MARTKLSATCAAVVLSMTFVSAQNSGDRAPDRSLPNNSSAKAPQITTISGCVVRDAANDGQATVAVSGMSYALVGKRATEFDRYLGKRVEVTGTLDSGSTGARATSGSTAPKGRDQKADVPATETPRDNTAVPLKTDKGTTDDLTSRLHVTSIQIISPSCLQ